MPRRARGYPARACHIPVRLYPMYPWSSLVPSPPTKRPPLRAGVLSILSRAAYCAACCAAYCAGDAVGAGVGVGLSVGVAVGAALGVVEAVGVGVAFGDGEGFVGGWQG